MIAKQENLARMTGISRSTINAIENNRIFLSAPYALLIAEVLGCKIDDLYEKRNVRGDRALKRKYGAKG
jgi:DNA-binding XRE family transcriptional regulator